MGAQVVTPDLRIPAMPVDTFSLDNGLRVIVSEDHSTPVVAVEMWYHVGSAQEPVGRSGFAHFFEHMLFEDTENMAEGEFARLIHRAGGVYNGTTDTDRTAFSEVLPSNRVNLALWSHAERMARLRISASDFETQRQVVKEERRLRVDNQPYAASQLSVDTVAQRDYAPYRHTVIGSMTDLEAATVDDAREFYRRFYAPNHAVLTVVGDVAVDEVRDMVEEYFGDLPRGIDLPALPPEPVTPRADGERRRIEPAPLAQLPLVWMAFNVPPADHEDHYALTLASQVLATGESSRLRRRLISESGAALDVVAQVDRRRGPGLLLLGAVPNQGVDVGEVERMLTEEVERLGSDGVTLEELEAARNQVLTGAVTQRLTVQGKAQLLQSYMLYHGSPFRVNEDLARFYEVTVEDVRRVASTYLVSSNRTVVIAQPTRMTGAER
jgi:predicted Zn-dependent peptidase